MSYDPEYDMLCEECKWLPVDKAQAMLDAFHEKRKNESDEKKKDREETQQRWFEHLNKLNDSPV